MTATVANDNISFSSLKDAYVAGGGSDADGDSQLKDHKTDSAISKSMFAGAGFTNGDKVPSSGPISIHSHMKGKTFGSSGVGKGGK